MKNTSPPLFTWVLAIVLVLAFYFIDFVEVKNGYNISYYSTKIATDEFLENFENEADDFVVLIIGSSQVGRSTETQDYFKERFAKEHNRKVKVQKMFMNSLSADKLIHIQDFYDAIIKVEPDLICIEAVVLTMDLIAEKTTMISFLNKYFRQIAFKFEAIKGVAYKRERYINSLEGPRNFDFYTSHSDSHLKDSTNVFIQNYKVRSFKSNAVINSWFDHFKSLGIDMAIINFPKPRLVRKAIEKKNGTAFDKLCQKYQAEYDMTFWKMDQPFYDKYFNEGQYLNIDGMEVFNTWIIQKINEHKTD